MIGIFINNFSNDFIKDNHLEKSYVIYSSEERFLENLDNMNNDKIIMTLSNDISSVISSIISKNIGNRFFICSYRKIENLNLKHKKSNNLIINDTFGINDNLCIFDSNIFKMNLSMIDDIDWSHSNLTLWIFSQIYHIDVDVTSIAKSYLPYDNSLSLDFLNSLKKMSETMNVDLSKFIKFNNDNPKEFSNDIKTIVDNHNESEFYKISKDNVLLITLCYNEIKCLPFAVDYWKKLTNHVIVYDNGSTDGSIDFLKSLGGFVTLKHFEYKEDNKINDEELREFKNNIWKEYRDSYDWIIICDVDELLYVRDVEDFYNSINKNKWTIVKFHGIQLVATRFPRYVNDQALAHKQIKYGVPDKKFDKCLMFNCKSVEEMNYEYGAHMCHPKGNVRWCNADDAKLFHFKFVTEQYVEEKYKQNKSKLSQFNIDNNLGKEYLDSDNEIHNKYMWMIDHCQFIDDPFSKEEILKEPSKISHASEFPTLGNKCCIVILIYKENMSPDELISFNSISRNCEGVYDIYFVGNSCLGNEYWKMVCKRHSIKPVVLDDSWFESICSYNKLCLNPDFYKIFSNYKYMMIFQLDGYMFYNDLDSFVKLDYDYYGALHYSPYLKCGNGGISLRKVSKMISVLESGVNIRYDIYEDVFFSNCNMLEVAPNDICMRFCICDDKEELKKQIDNKLPMCCHYLLWDHFWDNDLIEDYRI